MVFYEDKISLYSEATCQFCKKAAYRVDEIICHCYVQFLLK